MGRILRLPVIMKLYNIVSMYNKQASKIWKFGVCLLSFPQMQNCCSTITSSLFSSTPKPPVEISHDLRDDFSGFRNPATFLHAYTCLPLQYALRQATGTILQDVCASGVLFSLLMCRHKVKALVQKIKSFFSLKIHHS